MKRWLSIAAVCLVGLLQVECRPQTASAEDNPSNAPRNVEVAVVVNQAFDSIGAIVDWAAPPPGGIRRFPLSGYNVRVVHDVVGDTLASSFVAHPTTEDTLWMGMPPLGDTLAFYAAVASVDTAGFQSEIWALSNVIVWVTTPLLPLAPDSVNIDTMMGALVIDSLQVITHANADTTNAGLYRLLVADTLRFAAVLFSGPSPVECCCQVITDPIGTHPCDQVQLVSVRSLVPSGYRTIPYVRAARFNLTGDTTATLAKATIGARMMARGNMLLPELLWQQRRAYAWFAPYKIGDPRLKAIGS